MQFYADSSLAVVQIAKACRDDDRSVARLVLDVQCEVLHQSLSADIVRVLSAARDFAYYSGSSTLQGFIA